MANTLIGYRCRLHLTLPYPPGGTPQVVDTDIVPAGETALPTQGEAQRRQATAMQVITAFQTHFVAPKGWAPLSGGCNVEPVFADLAQPPFSSTP